MMFYNVCKKYKSVAATQIIDVEDVDSLITPTGRCCPLHSPTLSPSPPSPLVQQPNFVILCMGQVSYCCPQFGNLLSLLTSTTIFKKFPSNTD